MKAFPEGNTSHLQHIQAAAVGTASRSSTRKIPTKTHVLKHHADGSKDEWTDRGVDISPTRTRDFRRSFDRMRSQVGSRKMCGQKKTGTTKRQLHLAKMKRWATARAEKAAAEKEQRREVERQRKAVLRKLRCRKQRASSAVRPSPLVEIAELFLGADAAILS